MTKDEMLEHFRSVSSNQAVLLGIIEHVLNSRITERDFTALEEMIKALKEIRIAEKWN